MYVVMYACVGQQGRQATVARRCSTCDNDNEDDDHDEGNCDALFLLLVINN